MLLGIDYGTTRTVVAVVDRGNYPVVSFQSESGDTQEWYPSMIAAQNGGLFFGFEAAARQNAPGTVMLPSFKRELAFLGPESSVAIGAHSQMALELLTGFLTQLRRDLYERSNLRIKPQERLEVMISVPANANSNQRFITLEAFKQAGFEVRGTINEPSAAGIEYAHHYHKDGVSSRREYVVVYDLGGGTFDSSLISMAERMHEVVSSQGIAQLGGDDFDQILLDLALAQAGIDVVPQRSRLRLLEECREKKEGLHPNTRKLAIDLGRVLEGAGEVIVSTNEFYEQCRPLVEQTINALEETMEKSPAGADVDWRSVAAVYMVGGSSDLPIVARMLRERYGRQVRKSPYPHAATAIGLAIAVDSAAGYSLRERFTRHFGVWRETETGRSVSLDVLFEKDTLLPESGKEKLIRTRAYYPAHNIGHFRYLECSRIDEQGHPTGDITPWDEIYYPFDPQLQTDSKFEHAPIMRSDLNQQWIEELYTCDQNGIIEVSITNHTTQYQRRFRLRHNKSNQREKRRGMTEKRQLR